MMGMNMWGSIYMSLFMFGWPSGGGWEAVKFLQEHPMAALDILLFCLCGAVGQNFIFLTISRFGALTNTTITTTRKFVSILVSSVWNGNHLSLQQWAGVAMVFSGLSYQIYLKWTRKNSHTKSRSATSAVDHTDLKKSKWPGKLESEEFLFENITHWYILSPAVFWFWGYFFWWAFFCEALEVVLCVRWKVEGFHFALDFQQRALGIESVRWGFKE